MNDLIKIINDVPVISTVEIAKGFEVEHFAVLRLVKKYESEFQGIRTFDFKSQKSGGRPTMFCLLDEEQTTFLVTLMRNSDIVIGFKLKLTREFYRMKKLLSDLASQQQNSQWLDQRKAGIPVRRIETDIIQRFVRYATDQGSINAKMYYANISKMQNKALFFIEQKFKNIRDILNLEQLSTVVSADKIVTKALEDGMEKEIPYREIYQLAKTRIEMFAEIHGKTLIPNLSGQKQLTSEKG